MTSNLINLEFESSPPAKMASQITYIYLYLTQGLYMEVQHSFGGSILLRKGE